MSEASRTEQPLPVQQPPHATGDDVIEADDTISETDSTLGSDSESTTTSLASSVLNYQYENGRRYHAYRAGQYIMPNDETEQDRLDLTNHVFSMLFGGRLHLAPLGQNVHRALDIGTGTGVWAVDFADMYPSAEVIGTDLSPIQPVWVPQNLTFEIDDAESEWTYPADHKFDYIHIRTMAGSIANWEKLIKQAYDHLAPGGWLELVEPDVDSFTDDDSLPEKCSLREWIESVHQAAEVFGRKIRVIDQLQWWMKDTGFVHTNEEIFKIPQSPWPKDKKFKMIGHFTLQTSLQSLEAYGLALLTRALGWTNTQVQVLLTGVRKDLINTNHHIYTKCHVIYGQKPPVSE